MTAVEIGLVTSYILVIVALFILSSILNDIKKGIRHCMDDSYKTLTFIKRLSDSQDHLLTFYEAIRHENQHIFETLDYISKDIDTTYSSVSNLWDVTLQLEKDNTDYYREICERLDILTNSVQSLYTNHEQMRTAEDIPNFFSTDTFKGEDTDGDNILQICTD